jgi:hypothetical protein
MDLTIGRGSFFRQARWSVPAAARRFDARPCAKTKTSSTVGFKPFNRFAPFNPFKKSLKDTAGHFLFRIFAAGVSFRLWLLVWMETKRAIMVATYMIPSIASIRLNARTPELRHYLSPAAARSITRPRTIR